MWPSKSKKRAKRAAKTSTSPRNHLYDANTRTEARDRLGRLPPYKKASDLYSFELCTIEGVASASFDELRYLLEDKDLDMQVRLGTTMLSYMFGWSLVSINDSFFIFF